MNPQSNPILVPLLIHIDNSLRSKSALEYLFRLWSVNTGHVIDFIESPNGDAIHVGSSAEATVVVEGDWSRERLSRLKADNNGFILNVRNEPDYLLTAFYLINSLQEYGGQNTDELGRFRYQGSLQQRCGITTRNLVQECFDELSRRFHVAPPKVKSRFFLTHDIDLVFGAIVEDGFNVLKKGRVDHFLKLLAHAAIGKPDWLNMDQIMKIESEYDCKSVFYWLVNKGKLNARERNSDYRFSSSRILSMVRKVEMNGFENSLHKSISTDSFEMECAKFGSLTFGNRYHYLKFSLPGAYHDLETAGIKLDASLGFAEHYGFRNNYGLPFNPFNFEENRPFSFVEAPLHVMDRTFFQYQKKDPAEAWKNIFDFFEKNKDNCVLSILWHNNFFTDYKFKGYLDLYKKILAYIRDNGFTTVSQREIFEKYSIVKQNGN